MANLGRMIKKRERLTIRQSIHFVQSVCHLLLKLFQESLAQCKTWSSPPTCVKREGISKHVLPKPDLGICI